MTDKPNMFQEPKVLKTWAINLANALGGQRVDKSAILVQLNTKKVNILLDEFVLAYNNQYRNMQEQTKKEEE